MTTNYTYYINGLAGVSQSGQTRTYTRDFLGRVLSESHPEASAPTYYTYDSAGRLYTRTDARGVVTTYGYDNDGWPTTTVYSDGTPTVTRYYDESGHNGYLTHMTDAAGSVAYTYNSAGDLASEARTFTGVTGTFTTSYGYDAEGKLTQVTYPSGRVVNASYASGSGKTTGRLSTLTDATVSATLLGSITDNAAGQITSQAMGGGAVTMTRSFNNRFELTGIAAATSVGPVLNLGFDYGAGNTGKIRSRSDSLQPEHSVNYTYDRLQRLSTATADSPAWSISWGYDDFGNRTAQTPTGLASSFVGSQSSTYTNNQVNGLSYDDAGNILSDGTHPLAYDGENRLKTVSAGGITYVYDGDGQRVERIVSGGDTTYYLYGQTGLMSEFSTNSTLSNATAAASSDRLKYKVAEQTGTGVLTVAADGTPRENNRVLPFGEPWHVNAGSDSNEKFTSYQRDGETDLDYAMARYYSARSGRFMTPDPGHVGASLADPQSWNAYVYSGNDPINFVDPSGLCEIVGHEGEECPGGIDTTITVTADPSFWDVACTDFETGKATGVCSGPNAKTTSSLEGLAKWVTGYFDKKNKEAEDRNKRCEAALAPRPKGSARIESSDCVAGGSVLIGAGMFAEASELEGLVKTAGEEFPAKALADEWHHVIPKYLGGGDDGLLVKINSAYHQQITNAFREAWKYGQSRPTAEQLLRIVTKVYTDFPLPK